jgi:hypothetical protein
MSVVETLITAAALIVGLVLLWTWRKGLEVSSFHATLLSVIEIAGFVISIVALGWLGVAIFVGVSVIATLAWSIVLAIKQQSILVGAAVQGEDLTTAEAKEIWQWMRKEKSFAAMPALKRAELIRALSAKARNATEIQAMAMPIAQLALIFACDPLWLAPRFDQLLRLYGYDPSEAEEVADRVTRSTQIAPISFEEMVGVMLTAGGGGAPDAEGSITQAMQNDPFNENVRAATELQIREDGEDGIRLNGGPMNGWLVLADAPALMPDWYKTWPPGIAEKHEPGRYEVAASGTWAEWIPRAAAA